MASQCRGDDGTANRDKTRGASGLSGASNCRRADFLEPRVELSMIENLIRWAVQNRLVVLLLAVALLVFGLYAFNHINVEAYPDPAPAIVEVVARYPGASAEEVERQVTIPLEVALAGMPGLKYTRTQSLFELCHIRNQFEYGVDQQAARQEILNRLQWPSCRPGSRRRSRRSRPPAKSSATS